MSWNPFKNYRIDLLLFTLFTVIFIPLFVIVIWFSYNYTSKEFAKTTSQYQQVLLEEIHKQFILLRDSIEQMSLTFSRNEELQQFLSMRPGGYERYVKQLAIESLLAQITYSSSNIESVDIIMANSPVSTRDFAVRIIDVRQLQEEDWFAALAERGSMWIGERAITTTQGAQSVVSFARTIYSNRGDWIGVLMINMKAGELHEIMAGEAEGGSSQRFLIDSAGGSITHAGNTPFPIEQIHNYAHYLQQPSGHSRISGIETRTSARNDFLIVWSRIPRSDWILVEITDWNKIAASSLKMAIFLLLIGGFAVVVALLLILYVSKQFTKPISLLLKEMGKFNGSSVTGSLPTAYKNEFGAMFQGYRRLNNKIIELYQSLEEQYERQKESELKALQAMINPHFLYNTLDQINWMAIEKGQGEISHILELVGKIFRIGLSNGKSFITIREELTLVSCYIQIQQVRWKEGLTFAVHAEEALLDCKILKMTIQPFIENSIIHGFHGRIEGHIEINVTLEEPGIAITIKDNGIGIREDWQFQQKETGGYGTRNVIERIASYFGSPYGVDIQSDNGQGTLVCIRLPALHH